MATIPPLARLACWRAKKNGLLGRAKGAKAQNGISEFFGELSKGPPFFFYGLGEVLISEFGDLILRIRSQDLECGRGISEFG
jgi:hypothetical protein